MSQAVNELPFPWTCGECREQTVERQTLSYSTEVQYDGRIYTVEVPELRIPRCTNCGAMVRDDSASDQIIDALRRQLELLTPQQIRNNRESLRLKQQELASYLGVGTSTVSRWETGAQIQQRSLDRLMRIYFEYPEVRDALADKDRLHELGAEVVEARESRPGSSSGSTIRGSFDSSSPGTGRTVDTTVRPRTLSFFEDADNAR